MSRIGKNPIQIPEKTDVTFKDGIVKVNGPKGSLEGTVHSTIELKVEDGVIDVVIVSEDKKADAFQSSDASKGNKCSTQSIGSRMVILSRIPMRKGGD